MRFTDAGFAREYLNGIDISSKIKMNWTDYKTTRLKARKEWPRIDSKHINWKRVRKIVQHFENARFS